MSTWEMLQGGNAQSTCSRIQHRRPVPASQEQSPPYGVQRYACQVEAPRVVPLKRYLDANGSLLVLEEGVVPFPVVRTFVVQADAGQVRGRHAHLECSQFLAVVQGTVRVSYHHGLRSGEFGLTPDSGALLMPPLTWAEQLYVEDQSTLVVACDKAFNEWDYIRDWATFSELTERMMHSGK